MYSKIHPVLVSKAHKSSHSPNSAVFRKSQVISRRGSLSPSWFARASLSWRSLIRQWPWAVSGRLLSVHVCGRCPCSRSSSDILQTDTHIGMADFACGPEMKPSCHPLSGAPSASPVSLRPLEHLRSKVAVDMKSSRLVISSYRFME